MKTRLIAFLVFLCFSFSAQGQILWDKIYGPPQSHAFLSRMIPLANGGYLLVGDQASAGTRSTYTVRTNVNGDTLWTRKYKPFGLVFCLIYNAAEDHDGNLVLVGGGHKGSASNYDGFIMKLKPNGDTIWTKKAVTPQYDSYSDVIIGNDGNYIINAFIQGASYLQKRHKNGTLLWSRSYEFSPGNIGGVNGFHKVANGYQVFIESDYQTARIRAARVNENGAELFSFINKAWQVYDVAMDPGNNFLVCGAARLFKLNPMGDTLWSMRSKVGSKDISIFSAKPTTDGNYIAVFDRNNGQDGDVGLMKVDPNGTVIKDTVFYRFGYSEYSKDIVVDANGDYVFAGYAPASNGQNRFFLANHRMWKKVLGVKEETELASGIKLYPNPATDQTTIESEKPLTGTFGLYNLQGKNLWRETVSKTAKKIVPLQNLSPGIYILRFVPEDGSQFSRKLIKR